MKRKWVLGMAMGALAVYPAIGDGAEHGGQEHAGQEHAGQATIAPQELAGQTHEHAGHYVQEQPSAEELRQAIRNYISQIEQDEGAFTIEDEITGSTRTLTLDRVHERVGKTGDFYYSCTDMRDASTGELLDLDFDVEAMEGALDVVDVRIHKVNGQARYTYDDQDNRISIHSPSENL